MEDSFDAILTKMGTGKWTMFYLLPMMYWYSLLPYHAIAGVFMAPPINHTCTPPPIALTPTLVLPPHATHARDNTSYSPHTPDNNTADSSCSYLVDNKTTGFVEEKPCTEWDFDTSLFKSTVTSEFQLVCGKRFLQATYQSMYMMGMLVGAFFNGFLADKYGRWTLVAISTVTYSLVAVGSAWLPSLSWILIARFVLGMMHPASLQTGYILVMEVMEVKMRTRLGVVQFITWTLSTMLYSGWAYLIREWRWLQTAVSLPSLLFLPMLWVMGESPRWLAVMGQHDKALKELKRGAKWNKVTLPPDHELLAIMHSVQEQAVSTKTKNCEKLSLTTRVKGAYDQFIILFRTPKLRMITFVTCIDFFVVAMLFFGLTAGASTLGVDPFVYLAISAAMELPASTLMIPFIEYFGRKKMTASTFLFCAAVLLAEPPIPDDLKWLSVTLVMLGKMSATAAFSAVWLFAMELYPTEIRTQGFGSAMISSRLGAVIAPFIMSALNEKYPWGVSLVFGVAALIAGISVWPLDDTKGAKLPDTIAELEGRNATKTQEKHEGSNGAMKRDQTTPC